MKSLDSLQQSGALEGMMEQEREQLPFIMIELIAKMQKKRSEN